MKTHLLYPFVLFAALLTAALATGNPLILLAACLIGLTTLVCLISVVWAGSTLSISVGYTDQTVQRGSDTEIEIRVRHRGLIPIAPVLLQIASMNGEENREIRLKDAPGKVQTLRMPIHAAHVGVFTSGIKSCTVEDLFGLFSRTIRQESAVFEMIVLPQTFQTEPLAMAPGDPGSEMMARATEDLNAPNDIRSYQPGDAMKKIHWKLSLRKGELMVRKFDEPLMQDVLILTDCSSPPSWGQPEAEADIRDAVIETAASLFADQIRTGHPVRMPLGGSRPAEADSTAGTAVAFEYLARTQFTSTDRFERVLQMESNHLQKVGCAAVVSARLNYTMVDLMIHIHRAGPNVRLYFVTYIPDDPNIIPLISRLQQSGIEVAYVTPDYTSPSVSAEIHSQGETESEK